MANHVSYSVEFIEMNDEAQEKLEEIIQNAERQSDGDISFDQLIAQDVPEEERNSYNWFIENVGPKWCHIEDIDEYGFYGYSAWDAPTRGVMKLVEILSKYDPNMITVLSYEDEMPNFIGVHAWVGEEWVEDEYIEFEYIRQKVVNDSEDLVESDWDIEEEEWISSEKEDIFWNNLWDTVHEMTDDLRTDAIEIAKEHRDFDDTPTIH
jgi:hypothetical protein